jgi:iron complex transport system substrate-binding protein
MNDGILKVFLYCLISIVGFACTNEKEGGSFSGEYEKQMPINLFYAQGFSIDTITGGLQKIIIADLIQKKTVAQYVLVPHGCDYEPSSDEVVITTPISDIGILSSSYIGFLDLLGQIENISIIENHNYIYNGELLSRYENGQSIEIGSNGQINIEKLIMNAPDVIFTSAFTSGLSDELTKAQDAGVITVQCSEWQENHPLARAEWIKLFGALTDQEELADSLFNVIETNYNSIKNVCNNSKSVPKVLFSAMYQDVWYMPGGKSYLAKVLQDANGTYAWSENDESGSLQLSFESVATKSLQNDVWINPEVASISELLNRDARYETFLQHIAIGVYQQDAKVTSSGGNDYWESGVVRPDWVLQDFGKMLHPELFENATFTYFNKLK